MLNLWVYDATTWPQLPGIVLSASRQKDRPECHENRSSEEHGQIDRPHVLGEAIAGTEPDVARHLPNGDCTDECYESQHRKYPK